MGNKKSRVPALSARGGERAGEQLAAVRKRRSIVCRSCARGPLTFYELSETVLLRFQWPFFKLFRPGKSGRRAAESLGLFGIIYCSQVLEYLSIAVS